MDFGDSPEEAAFRLRLREWLAHNNPGLPPSSTADEYWAGQAAWHQTLYDAGFFGLSWPTSVGGQGLPSVYDVILDEELIAAARAARGRASATSCRGCSSTAARRCSNASCPGWSAAASAGARASASPTPARTSPRCARRPCSRVRSTSITGHKVWTSYSDAADWCLVLARTDPEVPKHRGISAFAVPMRQDAITQRPLKMINGITREFGEVIFDGARVDAANMIGAPG